MKVVLCGVVAVGLSCAVMAQDRPQARSMTITKRGIVATSQTLASQAGAMILARGGSAVDAAIAANAVLGLVEPMMCGIGGDLFVIHSDGKTGKLTGLNASGHSPKGLSIPYLKSKGNYSMPSSGIHTVNVPGAVDGWDKMHKRFGKLPWKDLFAPAIYYAENGFPVTELIQWDWDHSSSKLYGDDNAKRVFLPNNEAPKVGQIFRNPELAKAYRILADGGARAFYFGPIRDAILKTSKRLDGTLQPSDFEEFQSEWVEPISTQYRGWKVSELPPNGQGIGALMMLNLMSRFPLPEWDASSPEAWHVKIEAQKLSFADTRKYNGDPRQAKIPVEGLLNASYAQQRAGSISPKKANCETTHGVPPGLAATARISHTIYLSAVDRDGNVVSWIQSISDIWGSGVVVDGLGFHLHDRAGAFSFDPDHPNALGPRKRPYHTIIPGFMEKDGRRIGFGIMRGMNQAQAHAQFVSYVADHEQNIQGALEGPRFTKTTLGGCDLRIESRVPAETLKALDEMGHRLTMQGDYSGLMGGGQAVLFDSKTGVKYGASSPRKDGSAIPEPDPYFPFASGPSVAGPAATPVRK